ncbi:hypothetical protein Tco_0884206 [Tanacetum coccineum]
MSNVISSMSSMVQRILKKETLTLGEIVSLNYIKSNKNAKSPREAKPNPFRSPYASLKEKGYKYPFTTLGEGFLGRMTHLVASLTLDSARSCVMQSAFLTSGKASSTPIVFRWGDNIILEGFLSSILLSLVIIVTVAIVVVMNYALLPDLLTSELWKWLPLKFEALKR